MIVSPCISICKTDPVSGQCYGCGRSDEEKKIWKDPKTTDDWKNNNLKELEKITDTSIYSRGNSILVKSTSKKNELVKNAIVFLFDQFINNGSIEKKDILSSINKFMISENSNSGKKIEYIINYNKTK